MNGRPHYRVGDRLVHARFGTGLVVEVRERGFYDILEVAFADELRRLTSIHPDIVGRDPAPGEERRGERHGEGRGDRRDERRSELAHRTPAPPASDLALVDREAAFDPGGSSPEESAPDAAARAAAHEAARRRAAAAVAAAEAAAAARPLRTRRKESPFRSPVLLADRSHQAILARYRRGQLDSYREVRLKLMAEELNARRAATEILAFDTVRDVIRYQHQERAVRQVVEEMRGRALLADEVGLGKTIEAGLILSEYVLRGLVRRALILVPAALQRQWRDELRIKFGLNFHIRRRGERFRGHPLLITTLDTARVGRNQEEILAEHFDIVIVDEAHRLKNHRTLSYGFASALASRRLLLLTATPVHNDLRELYNLVTLLRPGTLGTAGEFRRTHVARGDKRMPRNPQGLGRRLRQVMVRTRREDTAIPFPRRTAETVFVALNPAERALYDDVTRFVRHTCRDQDLRKAAAGWHLTLLVLQKEIGSSTRAAVHTLEKLKDRAPVPAVRAEAESLAARARTIDGASKLEHLTALLAANDEKAIIFTQFRGTLRYLEEALRAAGLEVATFYGGMSDAQREDAIRRFRQSARILVSTDAGGEGGNLQFCRRVINFDLPWNPMKVEQRIGRVHRLGQEQEVFVHNFSAQATLESRVLDILHLKLNMFELVVGEIDLILGNYPEAPAIEETVFRIWSSSEDEREIDRGFKKLGEELEVARHRYERIRELDREIFDLLRAEITE